jgi:pyrroloquinoline-quinone synthase
MTTQTRRARSSQLVLEALHGRMLLEHPFYRRWEAGALGRDELARYAEQYRFTERAVPIVLDSLARCLPAGRSRELVRQNLEEELGVPAPHTALFEEFANAVGARRSAAATASTEALVSLELGSAERDAGAGLATVAAYEVQASEIARSKADGLRAHYGLDDAAIRFWDVHDELEREHADWSLEALELTCPDDDVLFSAAAAAGQAWWDFLDERELSAAA